MAAYETKPMRTPQVAEFCRLFKKKVGTEYEVNSLGPDLPGWGYVVCVDLLQSELDVCGKIEWVVST